MIENWKAQLGVIHRQKYTGNRSMRMNYELIGKKRIVFTAQPQKPRDSRRERWAKSQVGFSQVRWQVSWLHLTCSVYVMIYNIWLAVQAGPGVSLYLLHEDAGHPLLPRLKLVQKTHVECEGMIQRVWRGIDGTAGLRHWTHFIDGSLPLGPVEPLVVMGNSTKGNIYTYVHSRSG